MAAERSLKPMSNERIERAERLKELPRVLPHPSPAPHLERERQEDRLIPAELAPCVVEMIPKVAVDRITLRHLLDTVDMVRERPIEELFEAVHLGEVMKRAPSPRIREPEPIDHPEAAMTIKTDGAARGVERLLDEGPQRARLGLAKTLARIPRQTA